MKEKKHEKDVIASSSDLIIITREKGESKNRKFRTNRI